MGEIVVGVDGSDSSRQALEWAAREAEVRGADLVVRAVLDGREAARAILAQLQAVTAAT